MNLCVMRNTPLWERGMQVVEEMSKCGFVKQLEGFILSDNKFNQMVDQSLL